MAPIARGQTQQNPSRLQPSSGSLPSEGHRRNKRSCSARATRMPPGHGRRQCCRTDLEFCCF
eukprot:5397238-Pyramimonas_sp.AAC.1